MIFCKLCELVPLLDKRTKIQFFVNSFEKFTSFEGTVFDFLKSYYYRVYSTDRISELKIVNKSVINSTLRIVVVTASE